MSNLLDVDDLHIQTPDGISRVHGVSFGIARGGSLGIVGESGSGKTLTCRAVLGILASGVTVTRGSISFDGNDILSASAAERRHLWGHRIGAVFQDPASYLNPSIPVGKQVVEPLRHVQGLTKANAVQRTLDLFRSVGLRDPERVFRSYVHELSGGMVQRVLIAVSVSHEPDLLIADEATTALDVTVQAEVLDVIEQQRELRGLTLLMVSHDLAVIARMCQQIVVFKDGLLVERGSTPEVLRDPQHPYTQSLVKHQLEGSIEHLGALA